MYSKLGYIAVFYIELYLNCVCSHEKFKLFASLIKAKTDDQWLSDITVSDTRQNVVCSLSQCNFIQHHLCEQHFACVHVTVFVSSRKNKVEKLIGECADIS